MLLALPLGLTACAGSIGSVEPPILQAAPEELTKPCERPVELPVRELTQLEVEAYWIQDRENLIRCGYSFQQLQDYYLDRDNRVTG